MQRLPIYFLGGLQIFVSLGAAVCGVLLICAPDGRYLQLSPALLVRSPFHDFLFPGFVLLIINGIGQAVAAILVFRKNTQAGLVSGIFGLGLIIWIFVQVNMIGGGDGLQYVYFILGISETVLAFFVDRLLAR